MRVPGIPGVTPDLDWATVAEELRIWSGALPAIVGAPARVWNGRDLTAHECDVALTIYRVGGAQMAYEWLSEVAW